MSRRRGAAQDEVERLVAKALAREAGPKGEAGEAAEPGREVKWRLPFDWEPRPHQVDLWQALTNGRTRADVVAHRRWGKDEVALHWAAWAAHKRVGGYWHLLPELGQGRRAIWDAINPQTGKRRIEEAFPPAMGPVFKDGEMKVELANGSTWQVLGSDNYDGLVGASVAGVVMSEWALARPDSWTYLRPILAENGGWALFLWTPRGRNHATRAFESRSKDPDEWFCLKAPATETEVFTPEQLEKEKAELIAELGSAEEGEARFASEYLVDFDAAAPGAYYASLLGEADRAGRIGRVPVDPALRVDTAWDLGIDDYTAVWFFQQAGREVRVVDYHETSGQGLAAIVRDVAAKGYHLGRHHLPHDVMVRELATGRSRYDTLISLGLSPIEVGTPTDPEERVNAARLMIPMCWFDAERCALGLERLRGYRKKWSRATLSYSGPLHDRASHGADAFGEFALNRRGGTTWRAAAEPAPRARPPGGTLSWMG